MEGLVYKITNNKNRKKYIGITTRSIEERFKEHCKTGYALHSAIKKYGKENFSIEILEDGIESLEELNSLERYFVKVHKSHFSEYGYNMTWGGETNDYVFNQKGNKVFSEETRRKMSENHCDVSGMNNPNFNYRYYLTEENILLKNGIDNDQISKLPLTNKFLWGGKYREKSKSEPLVFIDKDSFDYDDEIIIEELKQLRNEWWYDNTSEKYRYDFRVWKDTTKKDLVEFISPQGEITITKTKYEFTKFCEENGFKVQNVRELRDGKNSVEKLTKRSKFYGWKIRRIDEN